MKTVKAIKKIEKYLGVEVQKNEHIYTFSYEEKECRFHDSSGDSHSFHIRREDDHSCLMSDYFAGYYLKNLTQFLHSLKRPPAKYEQGALVKGRNNKRAVTSGISNKVGVVIDYGTYSSYNILWNGDVDVSWYPHERDLERAD